MNVELTTNDRRKTVTLARVWRGGLTLGRLVQKYTGSMFSRYNYFSNPFQKAFIELTFSKEVKTKSIGNDRISPDELIAFIQAKNDMMSEFDDFDRF